jgi:predicted ATPase
VSFRSPLAGTPLVGRESDLEWIDGLRERAHRGQPQLALTIGEAGIGKSRLVGELASRAQYRRAEILLGRGREGEDVMAFAPWVEALRPALSADLLSRLPPVARRDLARLLPEIADGPAEMPGGIEDGLRIFEAVARLLRELAARHPMVVVIEDLHWCDDMTLRLFRFLPRRLQGQPVLLVGTARTEEMAKNPDRGALLEALRLDPLCSSRTLASLSRDETAQLLRALLSSENDGPAALLADRVWHLSEGNPFVVLECARAIRERGSAGASLELPEFRSRFAR